MTAWPSGRGTTSRRKPCCSDAARGWGDPDHGRTCGNHQTPSSCTRLWLLCPRRAGGWWAPGEGRLVGTGGGRRSRSRWSPRFWFLPSPGPRLVCGPDPWLCTVLPHCRLPSGRRTRQGHCPEMQDHLDARSPPSHLPAVSSPRWASGAHRGQEWMPEEA